MVIARVTRYREGKIEVFVPYMGHSNKALVLSCLPSGARIEGPRNGSWFVARNHLTDLVRGLYNTERIDDVELHLYQAGENGCVSACFDRGEPTDQGILECKCSCIGLNHGSKMPPGGATWVAHSEVVGDVYRFRGGMRTIMYSDLLNGY